MTEDLRSQFAGTPYEFVRELGRGGMGVVVEARERASGVACAVKLILKGASAATDLVDRMRLEAETLAKATSAHFVGFRGMGKTSDGSPYYAMEKLVGRTLKDETATRGALPLRDVLVIAIQLFDGLAEAHRLGVVHRDIKPENLFLCDGPEPRLLRILDFGIAKVIAPQGGGPAPLSIPTAAGLMVGSLRWAAPEIVACEPVDTRTDIYSGGLVVFHLATGEIPWVRAVTAETLLVAQLRETLPRASEMLRSPDHAALDSIIARATAKAPKDRTASARDVSAELRQLLRERFGADLPPIAMGAAPKLVPAPNAGAPAVQPVAPVAPTAADANGAAAAPARGVHGVAFPRLQPGTTFERRYEIVSHLGQGGMGTVYRAKHSFLGRDIALKLIPLEAKALNVDARKQFAMEMELLAKLDHPNVVRIYDGGVTENDVAYIVMELLPGDSLRKSFAGGRPLEDAKTCAYIGQIAQGLAGLHAVPIIHRDIKPENIIVQRDGIVKIVDFGLARVRTSSKYATQNPAAMGTLHYMPKEQLMNEPLDEAVDVYALGLIMFECFSGAHPRSTTSGHFQNNAEAIASVVDGRPIEPLERKRPDLPPEIGTLIQRCTAHLPQHRPKAGEVVQAFAAFSRWANDKSRGSAAAVAPVMNSGQAGTFAASSSVGMDTGVPATKMDGREASTSATMLQSAAISGALYQSTAFPMTAAVPTVRDSNGAGAHAVGATPPGGLASATSAQLPAVVPDAPRQRIGVLTIVISVVFLTLTGALVLEMVRPGTLLPGMVKLPSAASTAKPAAVGTESPSASNVQVSAASPAATASAPATAPAAPDAPAPSVSVSATPPAVPATPAPVPQGVPPQKKPGWIDVWSGSGK